MTLTADELRKALSYDEATGVFHWIGSGKGRVVGSVAGHLDGLGYVSISVNSKRYKAHRLAWLYVYGCLPNQPLDHRNCIRHDNRIANLRLATHFLNNGNVRSYNKFGFKGVSYHPKRTSYKKWRAQIMVRGEPIYLGHFATPEEAHEAYVLAAKKHFGEFARAA